MTTSINSLLNKKGWTGEEVGKLLISCLLNDIKQARQPDTKPLFSQSDFEKIESTLTSDRDFIAYGVYRDLYRSIIGSFNRGQGLYQQFYNGFYHVLSALKEAWHAEDAEKSMENTPLIMTESQYKRLREQAIETVSAYMTSFSALVFHCLDNFLEADETTVKAEAPSVWAALEATKKIPATGNRFLPLYNETYGEGYCTLPDGRRSDRMTREEWHEALKKEFLKGINQTGETEDFFTLVEAFNQNRLLEHYRLFFEGATAIRQQFREKTGREIEATDEEIIGSVEALIHGVGESRLDSDIELLTGTKGLGFCSTTEWHTYEEPPEGLTLYDLLELYLEEWRGAFETESKDAIKHLKADAPDLYTALTAYIESKVPQARGLKANQLNKDIISWRELATTSLIGYSELLDPSDSEIIDDEDTTKNRDKRYRTMEQGIAILRHPRKSQVDEKGDYIEKNEHFLTYFTGLYALDNEKMMQLHAYINNFVYPALGYLYAFNALMGIIARVYELPELAEVAQFGTSDLENAICAYNNMLYMFYYEVHGNEAEKERKREIIKEVFSSMDAESLKPSKEAIESVAAELTKLGISTNARKKLKYLDEFIDRLMDCGERGLL